MVSVEVLAQNSFVLACQPKSSMLILRHTDVSTTEAYSIIVDRTASPGGDGEKGDGFGQEMDKEEKSIFL